MSDRIKKVLMGLAALAALAAGGGALAQAGSSGGGGKAGGEERSEAGERDGSATDPDDVQHESRDDEKGEDGKEDEAGEEDESARGPRADRAKAAALEITKGGTVDSVEREDEDGAAWEVEVTKTGGKAVEVSLDDSYQLVGSVEADDEREDDDGERDDGQRESESR